MSGVRIEVEEDLLLNKIVRHIVAGQKNPLHTQKVLDALRDEKTFDLDRFAKFSRKNPTMRDFCSNNRDAADIVAGLLTRARCPNMEVVSKDEAERHPLYDHLQSYKRLLDFHSIPRAKASAEEKINMEEKANIWQELDKLGSYYYLWLLCKNTLDALLRTENAKDIVKSDNLIKELVKQTDRFANLYGGLGYIIKAAMMTELEVYFADKDHADPVKNRKYQNLSITNFLCAAALENDFYSSTLLASVTNGEGPKALFKEHVKLYEFKDWKTLAESFKVKIGDSEFKKLETEALKIVQPDVKRSATMAIKMEQAKKPAAPRPVK